MSITNKKLILIVTNDSTVFLKDGIASAYEMYGGRVTEVKEFVARLDTASKDGVKLCDVSYGVITSHFGFVPGNYTVAPYNDVMDCKEDYIRVQAKKDYLGKLAYVAKPFDKVIIFLPKDMVRLILDGNILQNDKVIAVTSPDFKDECEARGWTYLERKGARIGNDNSDKIFKMIEDFC